MRYPTAANIFSPTNKWKAGFRQFIIRLDLKRLCFDAHDPVSPGCPFMSINKKFLPIFIVIAHKQR